MTSATDTNATGRIGSDRQKSRAFSSVFALQKGEGTPPLFFVPDLGGSVFYAKKFVAAFNAKQPVYGFRLDPRTDWANSKIDIPALAEKFADDLIASNHVEPYHIVGHSFAGIVAFETARQLELKGAKVGILAMLDAGVPLKYHQRSFLEKLTYPVNLVISLIRFLNHKLPRMNGYEILERAKTHLSPESPQQQSDQSDKHLLSTPGFVTMDLSTHPEAYRDIISHLYGALTRYEPKPYQGSMLIFKCKIHSFLAVATRYMGWQNFVSGELKVHNVDGDHLDIIRRDAQVTEISNILARKLEHYFDNREQK